MCTQRRVKSLSSELHDVAMHDSMINGRDTTEENMNTYVDERALTIDRLVEDQVYLARHIRDRIRLVHSTGCRRCFRYNS
ncbi:hypothetical protein AUEXF2481DRAFT_365020 [Aureobasidium subglaciale EXF-2481]|uniref:SNARE-complex protein Syntaxin-18 N-terminal domain-containing protein n=1 Tax=Aureobasidium subglaciale (strain EXF-2481) TaxID=1043005 RepID=A0A074Y5A3_AURSE|nr:uncharacterized protein AUEXF2481DRAFT_365020 [Aureobasidium subglaciale EXF-2481]KEQ92900.1 hypothetical protein AUEXF2481DRAFT_365020 [Aureobasidium subglaciale EXF-2481]